MTSFRWRCFERYRLTHLCNALKEAWHHELGRLMRPQAEIISHLVPTKISLWLTAPSNQGG
jgi:hypothetical protein